MRPHAVGFTLIELMVAVAIVGLLLGGMGAFLHGTLRFSSTSIASADRLRELNDGSGYLVDNLRRSSDVVVGTCPDPGAAGSVARECAALVVPIEQDGSSAINAVARMTYLRVPRGAFVAENPSVIPASTWADTHTDVLVEYRSETSCTGAACAPSADTTSVPSEGPYLVLDGLNGDPGVLPAIFTGASGVVTVRLQAVDRQGSTPASAPLEVDVLPRN